jgi:hypothetical protein
VLRAQENLPGALAAYRDSAVIADRLTKADPSNSGWQRDLAFSYAQISLVLEQQGKNEQALDRYRQSRAITARLKKQSPDDATLDNELSWFDEKIKTLDQAQPGEPGSAQPEQAAQ